MSADNLYRNIGYRVVGINPLPAEEALTNGVAIASEFIVFCVAGTILVVEYKMSERSTSAKAAAAKKEKDEAQQQLDDRFETLDTKILVLAERLKGLEKAIAAQEERQTKVWLYSCSVVDSIGRGELLLWSI